MNTLLTVKNQPPKAPRSSRQDWHKEDIKAAIGKAGFTLRRLSLARGMSGGYYREALHRPNPKAERELAEILGTSPEKIWPSRYEKDGTPKRGLYKGTDNGRRYLELVTTKSVRRSNGKVTKEVTPAGCAS